LKKRILALSNQFWVKYKKFQPVRLAHVVPKFKTDCNLTAQFERFG